MANFAIIHNPRCSKSRKTLDILLKNKIDPEIIEYLNELPSEEVISFLFEKLGDTMIRKKEPEFQMVKIDFKKSQSVVDAIVKYPKLLERPIVIKDNKFVIIGRPPENILSLIE